MSKKIPKIKEAEPEPVVDVQPVETPVVAKKHFGLPSIDRYWLWLGGGVGLLLLALVVGAYWLSNPGNQFIGLLVVACLIGGVVIVRRQIKHRHDRGDKAIVVVGKVKGGDTEQVISNGHSPNSLNIYADYDDDIGDVVPKAILFEYVEKPMGQPQRCLNLNKDFHVHKYDIVKKRLAPFVLPDRKYTDPGILARYLGLPAQRKYLRNRESLVRYIGPGLLVVANIAGFVGIIAMSGG